MLLWIILIIVLLIILICTHIPKHPTVHREFICAPCMGCIKDITYDYPNNRIIIVIQPKIGTQSLYAPIFGDLSITEHAEYMEYKIYNIFGRFIVEIHHAGHRKSLLIRRLGSHAEPGKISRGNIMGIGKDCNEMMLLIPMKSELFVGCGEGVSGNSQVIAVVERIEKIKA